MSAAFRSPFALWLGGGGAEPVGEAPTAGLRSLLAPWTGGAGARPIGSESAGLRSLLAPWVGGGAAAPLVAPVPAGFHGLLAFWIGGASARPVTVQPPAPVFYAGGGGGQISQSEWLRRFKQQADQADTTEQLDLLDQAKATRDAMRKRRKREEELLLLLS